MFSQVLCAQNVDVPEFPPHS